MFSVEFFIFYLYSFYFYWKKWVCVIFFIFDGKNVLIYYIFFDIELDSIGFFYGEKFVLVLFFLFFDYNIGIFCLYVNFMYILFCLI